MDLRRDLVFNHVLTAEERLRVLIRMALEGTLEGPWGGMPGGLAEWWDARTIFYARFPTRQAYCRRMLAYLRRIIFSHAVRVFRQLPRAHMHADIEAPQRPGISAAQVLQGLELVFAHPPALFDRADMGNAMHGARYPGFSPAAIRAEVAMHFHGLPMRTAFHFGHFRRTGFPPGFPGALTINGRAPQVRPFERVAVGEPLTDSSSGEDDENGAAFEGSRFAEDRDYGRDYW